MRRVKKTNSTWFLIYVLALGAALSACSEGREDPLGVGDEILTEGKLTTAGDGPNLAVSSDNVLNACQAVNKNIFDIFLKASLAVAAASQAAGESVRITGDYTGYAVVVGPTDLAGIPGAQGLKVTFYDYSDSGDVFIGGGLEYAGRLTAGSGKAGAKDLLVTGTIKVAGSYSGYFQFNGFLFPSDARGDLISIFAPNDVLLDISRRGSIRINSGDYTYFENPYPIIRN